MPPPDREAPDSDQDASSDEDFNPSAAPSRSESSGSDSESESQKPKSSGRKRKRATAEDVPAELDSGDEVTIRERKKRLKKKKKGKKDSDVEISDDEGGEGGFVRTRAQRRTEKQEHKPLISRKLHTTIDVDSVWAQLSALPIGRLPTPPSEEAIAQNETKNEEDQYITIKRRTKFAGQVTFESKRVHKDSAEAKLYLQEHDETKPDDLDETIPEEINETEKPVNRPLKRTSRFEPNPIGEVKGLPPHLQLRWPRHAVSDAKSQLASQALTTAAPNAAKLNVVQKSRHDWAGFVDKQGIQAELDEYGKSKASYLGREEFLNRTEARLEEERKAARVATISKPVRYAE